MPEYTRFFWYEPADLVACEDHMTDALVGWFPETADKVGCALWGVYEIDELIPALLESGEVLDTQLKRLGVRMGPVGHNCMSLH